ncbi:MAG: (Fe-S)-binding protein [bacterium]|nr:(Fe-S)-binding protein [bacterium]
MDYNPKTSDSQIDFSACVRCGTCLSGCPTYEELKDESYSPRGRVALGSSLDAGRLPVSPGTGRHFSACLLCLACEANCPNGVKTESIILGSRRILQGKKGIPLLKRAAFKNVLGSSAARRAIFPFLPAAKILKNREGRLKPWQVFKPFLYKIDPERSYPLPDIKDAPEINLPPLEAGLPRIFIFSGCLGDIFYPRIGEAAVSLIRKTKAGVILPRERICCGLPLSAGGDEEGARALARRNLEIINRYHPDLIVSPCPSCARFLKSELPRLLGEDPSAAETGKKVVDLSEYLVSRPDPLPGPEKKLSGLLTYHDPCHLARGMGISKEPRALLGRLPGIDFSEHTERSRCCGFGGSFAFEHYDLARRIQAKKVESLIRTGAGLVVTSCPGCIFQLEDGLSRAGNPMKVKHLYEVLDHPDST